MTRCRRPTKEKRRRDAHFARGECCVSGEAADQFTLPPDREFDRQWAPHILHTATKALETERATLGRAEEFDTNQHDPAQHDVGVK